MLRMKTAVLAALIASLLLIGALSNARPAAACDGDPGYCFCPGC
jgi:hypothetical protein